MSSNSRPHKKTLSEFRTCVITIILLPLIVVICFAYALEWKWYSLSVRVFRYFGGDREFNPLALVFLPFRRTKVFRFWKAFKDYTHEMKPH